MVTNLPAEAIVKLNKYSDAKRVEEKIKALEEFISAVPKHKGTENLLYWARSRLAELREEEEKERRKKKGGGPRMFVQKSGAGQVVVVGPPNSGKSSIISRLTNAKTVVSDVPFTTKEPLVGMMSYEDIKFQLIDTPPLIWGEGNVNQKVLALSRNADALLIVVGADQIYLLKSVLEALERGGIFISRERGFIKIKKKRGSNTISIVFHGRPSFTEEELKKRIRSYGIYNAEVEVYGNPSLDELEASILNVNVHKPAMIIISKGDLIEDKSVLDKVKEGLPKDVRMKVVSLYEGIDIGKGLFEMLSIKRIYTKKPNSPPDTDPLIIKKDATIKEIVEAINARMRVRYAKVWGKGAKFNGQRVGLEFVPKDGDIVELRQ
ncbi:MAG: 50S ribosome-binding GTPase [Caldisphaeraceae archaeon]|nr:50S ribosome-binding GTPase [Caldisphaeraceae archaeon]